MTIKQKAAAKKILENPRLSVGAAMREVGYSENTAVHPKDLTESKGWEQIQEEYFPDEDIATVIKEGLSATKPISALILLDKDGNVISKENVGQIEVADYAIRHKFVDSILKIKGRYKESDIKILQQFEQAKDRGDLPVPIMGDTELRQQVKSLVRFLQTLGVSAEEIEKHKHPINFEEFIEDNTTFVNFDDASKKEVKPQEAEVVEQVEVSEPLESDTIKEEEEITQIAHPKKEDVSQILDKRKQRSLDTSPVAYSQPVQQQSAPDTFRIGE